MNLGDNKTSSVLNKTCSMTDVYAPHSAITKKLKKKKNNSERETFYAESWEIITLLKNKSLIFIAGDFNARLGSKEVNTFSSVNMVMGLTETPMVTI